jgi:DNA-binding SARP family transcriptional activator
MLRGCVVEIRLLGNVEIHGDDGLVRPRRSGERCVLAVLALHARLPVTVATLVDHLWLATEQSNKSIDTVGTYLRNVRAAIKEAGGQAGWLRYDRSARSCVLDVDAEWVDYHRFRALATKARRTQDPVAFQGALRLWRGPALADVGGHWADNRRHTLESERLAVHEDLLDHQLVDGRHAEVVQTVAQLIDESTPTDRLLLQGARGLAGSGRHTAIRVWVARVAERMRETVDAAPSAEVLDEIERLIARPTRWLPTFTEPDEELRELLDGARAALDRATRAITIHAQHRSGHTPNRTVASGEALPSAAWVDPPDLLMTSVNMSCDGILARISQHDRCSVDAQRQLHTVRVSQVLRAEQDGADRWILVYDWEGGTGDVPQIVGLRNCRLGRVAVDLEAHVLVAEMVFDRPLAAGETLIMEYEVINPVGATADSYFRRLRLPVRGYVLEVQFDTDNLPLRCQQFSSSAGDVRMARCRDLAVSPTGGVHVVALGVGPGLFGVRWDWAPAIPGPRQSL